MSATIQPNPSDEIENAITQVKYGIHAPHEVRVDTPEGEFTWAFVPISKKDYPDGPIIAGTLVRQYPEGEMHFTAYIDYTVKGAKPAFTIDAKQGFQRYSLLGISEVDSIVSVLGDEL